MPAFDSCHLARWTAGRWTAKPGSPVTGFGIDTRQLRPGDVFVALRTERRDGHDFLAAAAQQGAAAALVARPVPEVLLPQLVVADPLRAFQAIAREHRLAFPGPVIGITGSAGKTSTKHLLALLLGPATLATEGNLNNHLGVPLTLTRLDPLLHRFAVVEAGISEPGEMAVLAQMIEPDLAIVTLVAPAHTEALGGLEGVAREKAVLAAAVRASGRAYFPESVAAFEPFRRLPAGRLLAVPAARVDTPAAADHVVFTVEQRATATRLRLRIGAEPVMQFQLPRVSAGMAQNAVLALAVARGLGVSEAALQERLAAWSPPALRGEIRRTPGQLLYLDCYNANPASMQDALAAFQELAPPGEPRLLVLGGMEELGADSRARHEELGRALRLQPADHVCVIGPEADAVRRGALAAGARPDQVEICSTLAPIADRLSGFRGAVFVKGSRKYRLEEILVGTPAAGSTLGRH